MADMCKVNRVHWIMQKCVCLITESLDGSEPML